MPKRSSRSDFQISPVEALRSPPGGDGQIEVRGPSTASLKRGRPPFNPFMMVCDKCKRRPSEISFYYASSGDHDCPQMTPEERAACPFPIIDSGGYVHGYAKCHGEHAEFIATFEQVWASLDSGQPIHMFLDQLAIEQQEGSPELTGEPEMKRLN